jgi:hypothetical protein
MNRTTGAVILLSVLMNGMSLASPRKLLVEMFTNAYCVECPPAHATLSSYAKSSPNAVNVRYIYYHNCNSPSDALYRASSSDANARVLYYGTGCTAPVAFFDGTNVETLYTTWAGLLDSRLGVDSPLTISLAGTVGGNTISVQATVTATTTISASDLAILFVLVESVDYTGGNGVTPNPNVMRMMMNGATGEPFSISNGQTITIAKSATPANLTNSDSSGVVVFVQRSSTKEVYQSEYIPFRSLTLAGIAVTPGAQHFALEQNFPNPFNPRTTIRFALPRRSHVTLGVYSVSGQELTTLVDGELEPGSYGVQFDGSALSSGVYIIRMKAEAFVASTKLLLLR